MIEEAEMLYDGRRKAVKKGELNLNEFSYDVTDTEKNLIAEIIPNEYTFLKSTKSQLVFKKDSEIFKFARFGCGDELYDGIKVNKKEVNIAQKYYSKNIFSYPEEFSQYLFKTKYVEPLHNIDLPPSKKTSAFCYVTDVLDEIDEVNAFKLKRSQVGYNEEENNVYVLYYGHLVE